MGGAGSQWLQAIGPVPNPVMLVGLQGCGKTTTAAKLAGAPWSRAAGRRLSPWTSIALPPSSSSGSSASSSGRRRRQAADKKDPVEIALAAMADAESQGDDVLIMDTAGRLHIDASMMDELKRIKAATNPSEILFVADAMTDRTPYGCEVRRDVSIRWRHPDEDGRRCPGWCRSFAAGRYGQAHQVHRRGRKNRGPRSLPPRAHGIADPRPRGHLTLVEKAQAAIDVKEAQELERKIRKDAFTLEDFRDQLQRCGRWDP